MMAPPIRTADPIDVLHAFEKKTQKTNSHDQSEHLLVRADLLIQVQKAIASTGLKQAEAAKALRVTQPRVSDLLRGRVDLFSTDSLIDMLSRLGVRALRLQPSLMEEAKKVAKAEGVSVNQLINVAVAEKVSALRTEAYFAERAAKGDIKKAFQVLKRAGKGNAPSDLGRRRIVKRSRQLVYDSRRIRIRSRRNTTMALRAKSSAAAARFARSSAA